MHADTCLLTATSKVESFITPSSVMSRLSLIGVKQHAQSHPVNEGHRFQPKTPVSRNWLQLLTITQYNFLFLYQSCGCVNTQSTARGGCQACPFDRSIPHFPNKAPIWCGCLYHLLSKSCCLLTTLESPGALKKIQPPLRPQPQPLEIQI